MADNQVITFAHLGLARWLKYTFLNIPIRTIPQNSDFNTDLHLYETGRAKIDTWSYRIDKGLSIDQGGVYSEGEKLLELLNDSHEVFAE
jgi:hypothetical protein